MYLKQNTYSIGCEEGSLRRGKTGLLPVDTSYITHFC
uniref:Uncharacterized protein n=1 Tax=Anguilla anguilla TaxID=7936 RepID=A0A0E9UKJ6_ANGAN